MYKRKSGMSLIVLVITIIVMIIMAGVVVVGLSDNNPISAAQEAVIKTELAAYKEDLKATSLQKLSVNMGLSPKDINLLGDDLKEYIPSISKKYKDKIVVISGQLYYINDNEKDKKYASEIGYKILDETDMEYVKEHFILIKKVKEIELKRKNANGLASTFYKGIPLETMSHPSAVTIRGIKYGYEYYKLEESVLKEMGVTNPKFGEYVVNYKTGAVLNINGKIINDKPVHSFNYKGNGMSISGLITSISSKSERNTKKYGDLEIVNFIDKESNGTTYNDIYTSDVTYRNNALVLTSTTKIPMFFISPDRPINDEYTLCVTVRGDLSQKGEKNSGDGAVIAAISSRVWTSIGTLEIRNNRLNIFSYDRVGNGKISIDVSKYSKKIVNIQVTGKRGAKTYVYINGELYGEYNSGDKDYEYKYVTIGDLRPGRGAKFRGEIYNFAVYSSQLSQDEVKQNWNYIRKDLNI